MPEGGCVCLREGVFPCMVGGNDGGHAGECVGSMRWCENASGCICMHVGMNDGGCDDKNVGSMR